MNNQETLITTYFPKQWEDLVLPEKIKLSLERLKNNKGYRLLLFSSPGTGKTTTARLMTIGDSVMYLSGSNDFNIKVMREKVYTFASGMSVDGKTKTIIIDEFENVKDNLQDAFKITLDQCKSVNFIFITNEVDKIIPAIRSRCTSIDYDFVDDNLQEQKRLYVSFILKVVKECGIKHDNTGIKALLKQNFPDFRHSLVNLQQIIDSDEAVTEQSVKNCSDSGKQNLHLYSVIEDQALSAELFYTEISRYRGVEKECFMSLGEPYFRYLNDQGKFNRTLEVAIVVSKYYDSYALSINKFVTLMTAIAELKTLFR